MSRSREYPQFGNVPLMTNGEDEAARLALKAHIEALMAAAGVPDLTELARRADLNVSYVRQWLSGKSRNPQVGKLEKVASVLGVSLYQLLTPGAPPPPSVAPMRAGRILPVRFSVQAGAWHERDDLVQVAPKGPPVSADPAFPADAQWLERVMGDSMDLFYPEGSWVHVVDAIAIGYLPRDEDFVTIERKREQGGLIERSLKQVAIRGRKVELWPRSRNPRWNGPLPLGAPRDEEDEVRIAALVLGGYLPTRR